MGATGILIVYLVVGCGAAIAVIVQRRSLGALPIPAAAGLVLVLWPFLLPAAVAASPETPRRGQRARRIASLANALRGIGRDFLRERERELLEHFVERLHASDARLADLDAAIATAPEAVRERLRLLRESSAREHERGLVLLEELAGQLTLLRFADEDSGGEREHVEALLARIDALNTLSQAELQDYGTGGVAFISAKRS